MKTKARSRMDAMARARRDAVAKARLRQEIAHTRDLLASRLDAGESPFVARELLALKARLFEIKYPDLKALGILQGAGCLAVDTDPGAENVAYHELDMTGAAKIIGPNAKDIPRADVKIAESTTPVKTLAAAYGFEWHEMKAAAMARKPLPEWKGRAARRTIDQGIDDIFAEGNTDAGLKGMVNHASVTAVGATGNWSGLTNAQILDDIADNINTVFTDTKEIFPVTDVWLPSSEWARLKKVPWSATGASDFSVLSFIMENFPEVKFHSWYRLESISGTKRMVMGHMSPDVLEGELPLAFEVLPPQAKGLDIEYICLARCGGITLRQPKAMRYVTGL